MPPRKKTPAKKSSERDKTLNLQQRKLLVMEKVPSIYKGGKAPANMGGFPFVRYDDMIAKLRKAMILYGITMQTNVIEHSLDIRSSGSKTAFIMTEKAEVTLFNADDPSDLEIHSAVGQGNDYSDKAPGKAQTYAVKQALLKAFCLESSDDPEADSVEVEGDQSPAKTTQRKTPSPPKKNGNQAEPEGDQGEGKKKAIQLMIGWGCASSGEIQKGNPDGKALPKDVMFKIMEQKNIPAPEPGGTLTADDWHAMQLAIGDLMRRKISPSKYLGMDAASVLEVLNQPARKTTKKVAT